MNVHQITGCKVQKAYTSLGTSWYNVYCRFQLLLAHVCKQQLESGVCIVPGST